MKLNHTLFLSAVLLSQSASAAAPWSLDSCINYAVAHNLTVKSREISTRSAEMDITEAKDRFLPSAYAGASQSFSFGRGLTADNTYANRNTASTGWNIGMQLPLFQGLRNVRNLEMAKVSLRQTVEQLESAKDDISVNVIAQYLQVLYCKEIHDVALEQVRLSEVELERRTQLLDAGKIPELDLLQAKSQLAQDELQAVTSQNDINIALLDLRQMLELPTDIPFDVQPLPDDADKLPLLSENGVLEIALSSNHSILASKLGVDVADRAIDLAKSGYLPTLSFSAGFGSNYYKTSGYDTEGFGSQMRHNLSESLGFSLNIPLFDGFSTRNSVRKAKLQRVNALLQLEETQNRLYKTISQAYAQAVAADKRVKSSGVASETSLASFEAMRVKYNYGKANATEFEQAKANYLQAVSTHLQAKYESALRRRILHFYAR